MISMISLLGQVVSEELLDPTCSGECQIKKLWCVQGEGLVNEVWINFKAFEFIYNKSVSVAST